MAPSIVWKVELEREINKTETVGTGAYRPRARGTLHCVQRTVGRVTHGEDGMAEISPLSADELQPQLADLANWRVHDGKLRAEFKFPDFVTAFAFMTQVAFAAEAAQHHPEWCNVYNQVTIDLVTHDAGDAISLRDVEFARQINRLVR